MRLRLSLFTVLFFLLCCIAWPPGALQAQSSPGTNPAGTSGIFISTGDNNYLGISLPIDSKAAIDASLDLFKDLGYGRLYWRGLENAVWMETNFIRKESCRYYSFWQWSRKLYEMGLDSYAVAAAHQRGIEIWGVGNLGDWASAADVPPFNDYPFNSESRLRINHPEWVPVDRHGVLRQGGAIDYSYPEARKAMIDEYMKIMHRDKYDGALFFTYAENHSVRFQNEFGFNEPVVKEFKRRYGIDLRTQAFTRAASRTDWVRLRGEYFTDFYRELKLELNKNHQKLATILDPHDIYFTQPWNVPEIMQTAGPIYQDLETWVREGLMDQLVVYGSASGLLQSQAVENALWLTRSTSTNVGAFTSSPPNADRWKPFLSRGMTVVNSFNEEEMFLDRSVIPPQPLTALKSDKDILRMRILAQIIYGQTSASVDDLAPLAADKNLLIRRMALKALGKTMDPRAIPIIERGLQDPENCVRSIAAFALGLNHGPKSFNKLLAAVDKSGNHSFNEITLISLQKFGPAIKPDLIKVYRTSKNDMVRMLVLRVLDKFTTKEDIPLLVMAMDDHDQFARFTAAQALGNIHNSPGAAEALITATRHEDPVVSDRAATSLALVLSRKEPALSSLRPQILEALKTLYGKLGQGCKRIDAEWGYRPVGNALLAMGAEGEAVLKNYMGQTTDKRMAESAWKSLYIRQRPNSFSEVTEKENEEAFRMRPAFLDKPDSLQQRAIEQLQSNLRTQPKLIKVHAAEYLLWLGLDEPGEVKKIFTGEEQRFGTESPARIPIWRVLVQTETDPEKKKVWIDKLLASWKDTTATDRTAAAESLSKINISLLRQYPDATQKILRGNKNPLSVYTFWSASVGITGADATKENRTAFMDLLSPGQDDNVKAVAAYSLRHLGGLTDKEWSRLAACALYQPIKPEFKVYLVSAAFVTVPEDSLQSPVYIAIRKELLQNRYSSRKDDQKELAAAISEKGTPGDLPAMVSLLDSDDPDVRSAAAYAILMMDRKGPLFKN